MAAGEPAALTAKQRGADFDAMVRAVEKDYAYFSSKSAWRRALPGWRNKALAATTRAQFAVALEGALEALRDDNAFVSGEGAAPVRRIPAQTDLWATWRKGQPVITAVRASSVADVAGLHPGQVVVTVHGVPVERVVREKLGSGASGDDARDWALRRVLAGPMSGPYYLGVRESGPTKVLEVVRAPEPNGNGAPLLARKVGEGRDLAYLRLRNNLGDPGLLMHFDAALHQMRETRGLILDLRGTESGGSPEVVLAILGRFIDKPAPWQVREKPGKARATDTAEPRGPFTYHAPLVVLVDRWTAAEGEALAAGLDAAASATLIGTPMAGLRGARREVVLEHSGFKVNFPVERTLHVNGTPREALQPDIAVDLAQPSGGPGDPILYQALKYLESKKR